MRFLNIFLFIFPIMIVTACSTTLASDVNPISDFDKERYLGKWYEIARIENSFEKGMVNVTAEYGLRDDDKISVKNRGYLEDKQKWKEAKGKAYFVETESDGYLKVSFFGPFYGSYIIFKLDDDYEYSFVTNHNKKYLWLLSRTPQVEQAVKDEFMNYVRDMNFETDKLIWVEQTQ